MRYSPGIHNKAMLFKSLLGHVLKAGGDLRYPAGELLVLNYHSTGKKFLPNLQKQLDFFERHFTLLSPADLQAYYRDELHPQRCGLFITFDDGLRNNLYAAEELERRGHRAAFFVVPEFIETPQQKQKQYYLEHIRPLINPRVDEASEDFEAMNWEEIRALAEKGHLIGSHTNTHRMIASHEENGEEIVASKTRIETCLGRPVTSFCSINNTLLSVGASDKRRIAQEYAYHFTTLPGSNQENKDPLFIKRRNVEVFWPDGAVYYALGKWDLKRWAGKRQQYASL